MTYKQFSAKTRRKIDSIAASRGVTKEEVVAQFERLFDGHGVSKHSRKVFCL